MIYKNILSGCFYEDETNIQKESSYIPSVPLTNKKYKKISAGYRIKTIKDINKIKKDVCKDLKGEEKGNCLKYLDIETINKYETKRLICKTNRCRATFDRHIVKLKQKYPDVYPEFVGQ